MEAIKPVSDLPPDGSNTTMCEPTPSRPTDETFEYEINAAPLHLHPLRTSARLQGNSSQSSLTKAVASHSRSSSTTSNPTSRETSPCPSDIAGGFVISRASSTTSSIAGDIDSSSINSGGMHINIDPDILLDRMGMDTSPTMNDSFSGSLTGSIKSMPCLNERMSEESLDDCHAFDSFSGNLTGSIKLMPCLNERMTKESLDDCHAFTDLKNVIRQIPSANAGSVGSDPARSRDGSVAGGSILGDSSCLLETLKEFEEFEEESDGADEIDASGEDEDNSGKGEIPALSFEIKHKMSLNDTNLDELCKEIEVGHTEKNPTKD